MLRPSIGIIHTTLAALALLGCGEGMTESVDAYDVTRASDLGLLAPGWNAEIVATVDQSYAGWDVEIGDADGDGRPEILTGTAPSGRVYQFRKRDGGWESRKLFERETGSGMVLGVRVVDLEGDGVPELLAGTGEYDESTAALHVMHTDGERITDIRSIRAPENTSSFTHGLPTADLDGDGVQEVISSYCGHGEVIRYDIGSGGAAMRSKKVLQLSGSGEDAWITDVDGDGRVELIVSNSFRDGGAKVQIHDFDPATGDPEGAAAPGARRLRRPPRVLCVGDGRRPGRRRAARAGGGVEGEAGGEPHHAARVPRQRLGRADRVRAVIRDPDLDLAYFEKMMAIADIDGDGRAELYISTRGDGSTEGVSSSHLGHVYMYQLTADGEVRRGQVVDFDQRLVQSSWLAVGDADGDGRPELVLATGKGDIRKPGVSWVLALHKEP